MIDLQCYFHFCCTAFTPHDKSTFSGSNLLWVEWPCRKSPGWLLRPLPCTQKSPGLIPVPYLHSFLVPFVFNPKSFPCIWIPFTDISLQSFSQINMEWEASAFKEKKVGKNGGGNFPLYLSLALFGRANNKIDPRQINRRKRKFNSCAWKSHRNRI